MSAGAKHIDIEQIIRKTVKETLNVMAKTNKPQKVERSYFKDTEKLLYAYPALKIQEQEIARDIEDLEQEIYSGRSKDIVRMPNGGVKQDKKDIQEERIDGRRSSLQRTKREIIRIERALEQIKNDEGYELISLKYFLGKANEEIVKSLNISERTVGRWRNRLINKLKIILFGADAIDIDHLA